MATPRIKKRVITLLMGLACVILIAVAYHQTFNVKEVDAVVISSNAGVITISADEDGDGNFDEYTCYGITEAKEVTAMFQGKALVGFVEK